MALVPLGVLICLNDLHLVRMNKSADLSVLLFDLLLGCITWHIQDGVEVDVDPVEASGVLSAEGIEIPLTLISALLVRII